MNDNANTNTPSCIGVGDRIIAAGRYETVLRVISHQPHQHPHAGPISGDWYCVEVQTTGATRYFGSATPPMIQGDLRFHWNLPLGGRAAV